MRLKQAYAYMRVSSIGQAKENKHGYKRQKDTIELFAKREKFNIVKYFKEPVSGCKGEDKRPAFMEMVSIILRENNISSIVVEGMDRLARELILQEQLITYLVSKGIDLYSANTGENVTQAMNNDPVKKAMVQVQGVFSELEKSLLVEKLRKSREAVRKKEGRCEGRKPFGYFEGEQEIVEVIKTLHRKPKGKKRLSYGKIANELNNRGIKPRAADKWEAQTVWKIIKREGRNGKVVKHV
jgi:DNA invertase Pin-like site-specific DNA recombinase